MQNYKKIKVPIKGMHCTSCELLIEEELKKIPEVERANVDHRGGEAIIYYGEQRPSPDEVNEAIRAAGYETGPDESKSWFSLDKDVYKDLGMAVLWLVAIYVLLNTLGVVNFNISTPDSPSELGVVLLIGLTAGFSTCLALVGSVVLGLSARHAEAHPEAGIWQKFRPHLFFNVGRIISYVVLGGVLGAAGSVFQLSPVTQGILMILVGMVMLITGLKLTGIFPVLEKWNLTMPKQISQWLGFGNRHNQEYSHANSFWLGVLTFFLPCGFTQAMQLLAISSGSFVAGALVMGLFALGTTVGLLLVGGVTSLVKGIFARRFFKFAGLVVVILSLFNMANGLNLTGWKIAMGQSAGSVVVDDPNVEIVDGVQVVTMEENYSGYSPSKFTIQAGLPVKWVINAKAANSCASSLVLPELKIQRTLRSGENIIEFTPEKTGRLAFSCAMGMYTGYFEVVDQNGSKDSNSVSGSVESSSLPAGSCGVSAGGTSGGCGGSTGTSGGCGGGCGGSSSFSSGDVVEGPTQSDTTVNGDNSLANDNGVDKSEVQVIKTIYTKQKDIVPNSFTVKNNQPVRLEIDVQESGGGCMGSIMIPGLYNLAEYLTKDKDIVMEFTPTKTGKYQITCGMGVLRGTIQVS
ncbi:MAG: sulfite exporter TauE/SafE family protein [Patescibacteria group bacterium]